MQNSFRPIQELKNTPRTHSSESVKIVAVTEHHYGFTTKYYVEYENGKTEWVYHCLKSFEPFLKK